jgi:hypothetical protein
MHKLHNPMHLHSHKAFANNILQNSTTPQKILRSMHMPRSSPLLTPHSTAKIPPPKRLPPAYPAECALILKTENRKLKTLFP